VLEPVKPGALFHFADGAASNSGELLAFAVHEKEDDVRFDRVEHVRSWVMLNSVEILTLTARCTFHISRFSIGHRASVVVVWSLAETTF
jgi:hypothetical protein